MEFTREINHLLGGLLLAFLMVGLSAAYWAVTGQDSILQRDDNPRTVEAEAAIRRGSIYDRHNHLLVTSTVTGNGVIERRYLVDGISSAVGYFSLRYGVGGAEAAYDELLRGDNLNQAVTTYFEQEVLHHPQVGANIRLTLDLDVQQQIVEAMGDKHGAAVVLSVPQGEVLALVSLPSYDPNVLDEEWEQLIAAPGNPFFNRVLQGQYQPGGMLQTLLMAAGILTNQPFDESKSDATTPIMVNDIELTCAVDPPTTELTLPQAYAYACPRPFAELVEDINRTTLENVIASFRLDSRPSLTGFIIEVPEAEATSESTPESDETNSLLNDLLGQGNLTINPLGMATLTAAIVNTGNAPQPYALLASQPPGGEWQAQPVNQATVPLMTDDAARRIRDLMTNNTQDGAAAAAQYDDLMIGGHAALAFSGEETQAWYIGFVLLENGQSAVVALVLEDTDDVSEAASMGGDVLKTVYNQWQISQP